jgi:outer membrane protein
MIKFGRPKKTAWALIVLGFIAAAAAPVSAAPTDAERTLTLDECIGLALENSKALHASSLRVESAEAKVKEINAARLPSLRLGASYTRLSEIPPFEITLPAFLFPKPMKFEVSPVFLDNYNLRLSFVQPLFTGFRLKSGEEAARWGAQASEEDYGRDRAELVFAVKSAYWNLFKARAVAGIVAENVEQVRRHLQDVENLFGNGLLTRNEVLRVKVQLSQVEMLRVEADNAVELASLWLNNVIGIPLEEKITIPAEAGEIGLSTPTPSDPTTCDEWVARALGNRPELKAMDYRVRAAESGLAIARSSWYPQVFFAGNYTFARPNPRILPSKDRFYDTWDFSISVSMDLWNWGMTSYQTAQAKAQIAQAQDGLSQVRDGVIIEVRTGWLALETAERKAAVAAEAVLQADENLRVTLDRFKDGVALNADVLDAEVALLQAKTAQAQAQADRAVALARLAKAAGEAR